MLNKQLWIVIGMMAALAIGCTTEAIPTAEPTLPPTNTPTVAPPPTDTPSPALTPIPSTWNISDKKDAVTDARTVLGRVDISL